jgi:outer membrane autotransporter protein
MIWGLGAGASAQTSWTNPAAGDWFNAGNWTAGVPNSGTVVTTITNGGTAEIKVGGADAGSSTPGATLTIGNGSTLDLQTGGSLNFETMVIQASSTFLPCWGSQPRTHAKLFDLLSGELYASVQSVLMLDSQYVRQMMLARMASAQGGVLATGVYGSDGPYGLGMGNSNYRPAPASWGSWVHAVGGWGRLESDGNAGSADRSLGGFFAGFDGPVG